MNFHSNRKHVIDMIFPFSLFFVFAVSALLVTLLAANIYQGTTTRGEDNYESRTVLSYVTEKIHQGDERGGVSLGTFDGHDSIIIWQAYGEQNYQTYIYEDEGVLRELFIQEGVPANAADGTEIMEVHDFQMEQLQSGLLRFSCTSEDGEEMSTIVSVLSE
ncbi:DUF4860 domain-containing protein [Roseburia sp. 499]|uniref:DUF4860 domain-containing protein n=1 Tax=Roseburia sp. 499 TaxID=1261634 RepID=UPI0009514DBA|nr:DUF4860 domain-containing protein [Roseburia sp. 499]WVK70081.1 DUF4860 domain-containing protein [Roseburia sp. 499]